MHDGLWFHCSAYWLFSPRTNHMSTLCLQVRSLGSRVKSLGAQRWSKCHECDQLCKNSQAVCQSDWAPSSSSRNNYHQKFAYFFLIPIGIDKVHIVLIWNFLMTNGKTMLLPSAWLSCDICSGTSPSFTSSFVLFLVLRSLCVVKLPALYKVFCVVHCQSFTRYFV